MATRKKYTQEFKQDAVRLVLEQGYNQSEAARNLGIDRGMLSRWVKESQEDEREAFRGNGKRTVEQEELRRLRDENRRLRMEREILKKTLHGPPPTRTCRKRNSPSHRLMAYPRGEAVRFLVALTPLKNLAQGQLRICVW
jgi:transposase